MGFKDADMKAIQTQLSGALGEDERLLQAFRLKKDYLVCTNMRLIAVTKKDKFISVPYRSITHWTSMCDGKFSLKGQIVIHIMGASDGITFEFNSAQMVQDVQKILVNYTAISHI